MQKLTSDEILEILLELGETGMFKVNEGIFANGLYIQQHENSRWLFCGNVESASEVSDLFDSIVVEPLEEPLAEILFSDTQRIAIEEQARKDAAIFVQEFDEPIDPDLTDWDSEAFAGIKHEVSEVRTANHATINALWPIYQAELVAETIRLVEGAL